MILVTGATGHLGTATLTHLLKNTTADNIRAANVLPQREHENKTYAIKRTCRS